MSVQTLREREREAEDMDSGTCHMPGVGADF